MRKGQIFTLDVLMALVAVTVILGYMTWQFEHIYSEGYNTEYDKIHTLSGDISQIIVKNSLAKDGEPNKLDQAKILALKPELDSIIESPYSYEVILPTEGSLNQGICEDKSNIAITRRLTTDGEIIVKVCI